MVVHLSIGNQEEIIALEARSVMANLIAHAVVHKTHTRMQVNVQSGFVVISQHGQSQTQQAGNNS